MIARTAAAAAMLVAACSTGGAQADTVAEAPGIERIAFEINSWGRPIDSWEVHADGTASHVKLVAEPGASFRDYRLEHRAFTVEHADFARLAAMAAGLRRPGERCELMATDMPYGALRLTVDGAEQTIGFNVGCQDAPYQAFAGQLADMDALVTGWAEAHAPVRVEQVGEP